MGGWAAAAAVAAVCSALLALRPHQPPSAAEPEPEPEPEAPAGRRPGTAGAEPPPARAEQGWPRCETALPVFTWDRSDPASLERVLQLRQPHRLRNAPSDSWVARGWSLPSVQAQLGETVPDVIVSRTPRLPYYNKRFAMAADPPLPGLQFRDPYRVRNLSSSQFFRLVRSGGNATAVGGEAVWGYFSSALDSLGASAARELRSGLEPGFGATAAGSTGRASLWIGSAGTVSHLHWDARPNIFVQLQGRKRFILAPADGGRSYPYSRLVSTAAVSF